MEFRSYKEHHGTSNAQQMAAISELKVTVDRLSHQVETKQVEVSTATGSLEQQQAHIRDVESKLRDAETARWILELTQDETTHAFVAPAEDPLDFDASSLPRQPTPQGAWELEWQAWEALRDHAQDLAS